MNLDYHLMSVIGTIIVVLISIHAPAQSRWPFLLIVIGLGVVLAPYLSSLPFAFRKQNTYEFALAGTVAASYAAIYISTMLALLTRKKWLNAGASSFHIGRPVIIILILFISPLSTAVFTSNFVFVW